MRILSHLFANNRAWAAEITRREPDFFARLSRQQDPRYLWVGCSDSRVPANQIVGLANSELQPGASCDVTFPTVLRLGKKTLRLQTIEVEEKEEALASLPMATNCESPVCATSGWTMPTQRRARRVLQLRSRHKKADAAVC